MDVDDVEMFRCPDCGMDAWWFDEDGLMVQEDFYVSDELWDAVCPDDQVPRWVEGGVKFGEGNFVICIGCFERRLGRTLTRGDLLVKPQALFGIPASKRFMSRWDNERQ